MIKHLLAGVAFAAVFAAVDANAAVTPIGPFTSSSPGTTVTENYPGSWTMTYVNPTAIQFGPYSWTMSAVATSTETVAIDYLSNGFYGFYRVTADMTATSNGVTQTVYSHGPANCCTSPSAGFNYSGSFMLNLVAGQPYSVTVTGTNGDIPYNWGGSVTLTQTVPEPASWAMMIIGFAGLGFAGFRRAQSKPAIG